MFVSEILEDFASVKNGKSKSTSKAFEREQMIDDVFNGQMPDFDGLPSWMNKKLDHAKSG